MAFKIKKKRRDMERSLARVSLPPLNPSEQHERYKRYWKTDSSLPILTCLTKNYGCQELPNPENEFDGLYHWLREKHLHNILQVPIRRHCMTGSGIRSQCHHNVLNLVHAYGGSRIGGYTVSAVTIQGSRYLICYSHSVWLTPEGKLADVTADNYFDNMTHSHFIPCIQDQRWTTELDDFRLKEGFIESKPAESKITLYILPRDNERARTLATATNSNLCHDSKDFGERASDLIVEVSPLNASQLLPGWLCSNVTDTGDEQFEGDLMDGGFSLPSKWTGKSWDEIREDFMKTFPAPQPTFHKRSSKKKESLNDSFNPSELLVDAADKTAFPDRKAV